GRDAADMAFIEAVAEAGRNIYGAGGVHCRDDSHDLGGGRPVEVGRAIGDEVIATDGHPLAIDRALECALLITVGTQGEVILAISPTRGDRGLVNSLTGGSDVFNGDRDGVVPTRFTVPDLRDDQFVDLEVGCRVFKICISGGRDSERGEAYCGGQ